MKLDRVLFSNVQSAIISINNKETLVAVKTLKEPLESMHSYKLLSEALILRKLNNEHQNILKMYGISLLKCEGKTFLQIFMEHCDDSLHDIVMKKRNPVPCGNLNRFPDCKESWSFVESIMKGLCSAFEYMHGAGFVHRDLKLANIMVKENHKVRLADFGLSKRRILLLEQYNKGRRPDCKIPLAPPKELTALLTSCWEADIHKRPTAAEVYRRLLEVKFD
ncbi:unnamed protein product [Mytilus edulis]|uniref:Protein kinase domain-containing protein n=1 Tax=Mytilus edulis TaxID=6550 RepID=A0A8S3VIL3_MYTED|nr:unnamed protein product [Mytilus edulis]